VFANSEHIIALRNDGRGDLLDPKNYWSVYTAINGDKMEVAWQVLVDRNLDNADADYQGKYTFSSLLQREQRRHRRGDDRPRTGLGGGFQHQAHRAGGDGRDFKTINGVKVVDGRHGSKYARYIPIPNSPHSVNTARDGIHVVINGKLSQTVSVIDVRKLDDLFDDKFKERDVIVAESELGLGPLHTAFDARGNAFTTLSMTAKWSSGTSTRRSAPSSARRSIRSRKSSTSPISRATTTLPSSRPRTPTASGLCR